jgi:hypothetical protein
MRLASFAEDGTMGTMRLVVDFNHLIPLSDWEFVAFLACMVAWGFIHSRRLGWL